MSTGHVHNITIQRFAVKIIFVYYRCNNILVFYWSIISQALQNEDSKVEIIVHVLPWIYIYTYRYTVDKNLWLHISIRAINRDWVVKNLSVHFEYLNIRALLVTAYDVFGLFQMHDLAMWPKITGFLQVRSYGTVQKVLSCLKHYYATVLGRQHDHILFRRVVRFCNLI